MAWKCLSLFVIAGVALAGVGCGGSSGSPPLTESLDQEPPLTGPNPSGISDAVDKAQTFTVGITGLLSRMELMVYESTFAPDLIIDVRATVGGVPLENDATVLTSFTVPPGQLPTTTGVYTSFDLEPFGIEVTAGDVLAICLRSPTGPVPSYLWPTQVITYAAGQGFHRNRAAMVDTWTTTNGTAAFRTYVKHP